LIGDQELVLQQIRASNQGQQLQARLGITDQNLQALGLQSSNLASERGDAVQLQGITAQERASALSSASGLRGTFETAAATRAAASMAANAAIESSKIRASAMRSSASIAANASIERAKLGLEGTKFSTTAGFLSDTFRTQSGNQQFGQNLAFQQQAANVDSTVARQGYANQFDINAANQPSMFDKILGAAAGGASAFFSGGFSALG
jgi:hypothetical protein